MIPKVIPRLDGCWMVVGGLLDGSWMNKFENSESLEKSEQIANLKNLKCESLKIFEGLNV